MGKRGEDEKDSLAKYLQYSYLGLQLLLSVGIPVALGIWLDRHLGTKVLFTLLGFALGFTAGIYSIYGELYRRGKGPPKGPRGDGDEPGDGGR